MLETWLQPLGWEGRLGEEIETHYSILARKIPWTEKRLAGCSPWGRKRLGHDLAAEQRQEQGMCTGGWEGERQGGHIQLRAIDDYVVHGH